MAAARDLRHVGAAGPARSAIDRHGAGTADADPAGEAIRQGRVNMALHEGDDVEHGLARALRHAVGLVAAVFGAAPERYRKVSKHLFKSSSAGPCYARAAGQSSKPTGRE